MNHSIAESEDNSLDMLDIYITTLSELVEKFKKRKSPNKFQKDEVKFKLKFLNF